MENEDSIFIFLNMIGAILGPVTGVMIIHFFIVSKCKINIDELYFDVKAKQKAIPKVNQAAYVATIVGVIICLLGFLPGFSVISDFSWFIGFLTSGLLYWLLKSVRKTERDA